MARNGKEKEFDAYITVRCSKATHEDLTALADADKRPMSNYIRVVLERHVETAKAAAQDESKAA